MKPVPVDSHVRSSPMLMLAARIAQTHHERWDGAGYPLGLAGTDIPIEGRITAVADVYDALSTERPYKKAFPRARCFEILQEGRGTQFDAQIVDAFFKSADEIVEVVPERVVELELRTKARIVRGVVVALLATGSSLAAALPLLN